MAIVSPGSLSRRDLYPGEDLSPPQWLGSGVRVLGEPTFSLTSVRHLGGIVVTVTRVLRPAALVHARALGAVTAHGRFTVGPPSATRVRSQGAMRVSALVKPLANTHTRVLPRPAVNASKPLALTHARALGSHVVTMLWKPRPLALAHVRTTGALAARGRLTVTLTGQTHLRAQGFHKVSGRALPASLIHQRGLGSPEVNVRILAPVALSRL